ncbi:MAG: bifunctional diaminohydroxyphosphoribosylaminopyrimidine deaminase/5-amino-6-(5-phosphoribosylamino)uracil reductase RibD [Cellvibrionales bacterium]
MQDEAFMAEALAEARKAACWAKPNPHVGCVIVRDDQILARGFTQPAGDAHAEIMALQNCQDPRGATVYVTLEPCSHWGRTGPCVKALAEAGVARVVVAIEDPNPAVAGRGVEGLREAGIEVDLGVGRTAAEQEIRGFLLRMQRGWGRVRVKLACSLDGRTAMASGESQWITGPVARQDVQRLRAASSVIITGVQTVLADDCSLTVREEALGWQGETLRRALSQPPTRAVLDTHGRTPANARVLQGGAPTLLLTGEGAAVPPGVTQRVLPLENGRVDVSAVLRLLGEDGANEILVEAGATLSGALFRAGLVDELVLYQAPVLLGASAQPLLGIVIEELRQGVRLVYTDVSPMGPDLRIMATPAKGT